MTLAAIILIDLVLRARDLTAFYTDRGIVPRAALLQNLNISEAFSLHLMGGSATFVALLFLLHALCALGLLFGWRTTWMSAACWLFATSLDRRNPLILSGGDDYLRLLLFWSMFIPWKTFDARRPKQVVSWGTAAILLQTTVTYWMTALLKWTGAGWREGNALYYVLHIDMVTKPLGRLLLSYPTLLKFLTYSVLGFEFIGPALLLCPILSGPIRTLAVFSFLGMQSGFYLAMHVGTFPVVSAAAMLLFLPSWFWDRVMPPGINKATTTRVGQTKWTDFWAAGFFACMLMWNAQSLVPGKSIMPGFIRSICLVTHLDQSWRMFTSPLKVNGWFIVPATLSNGNQVNLLQNGTPISWEKPKPECRFKSDRWSQYFTHVSLGWWKPFWSDYGAYECRSWNETHEESQQLQSLQIVFVNRTTPPPDHNAADYTRNVLLSYDCRLRSVVSGIEP